MGAGGISLYIIPKEAPLISRSNRYNHHEVEPGVKLTHRQQREAAYYDRFTRDHLGNRIDFTPVDRPDGAPWNSYRTLYRRIAALSETIDVADLSEHRALEIGCGSGTGAIRLAKLGYTVHGIDISQGAVEVARQLAESHGLSDRCFFNPSPAECLNWPDSHFDLVIGIDVLHHIEINKALVEIDRVLKPGGVAIFHEPIDAGWVDRLRETSLMRLLVSNKPTLNAEHHITEDERKIGGDELRLIDHTFESVLTDRFGLFSRLHRLLPARRAEWRSRLQRLDHRVLRMFPILKHLSDTAVMTCRKREQIASYPLRRVA